MRAKIVEERDDRYAGGVGERVASGVEIMDFPYEPIWTNAFFFLARPLKGSR